MPQLLDRRWYSPRVFEVFMERDTWSFRSGDSTLLVLPDRITARPYSLSSAPNESVLSVLIRRIDGGLLSNFLAECPPGIELGTSPPIPQLDLSRPEDMIWVATGTGISPFLSALRHRPDHPPRALYYGVRFAEDAADLPLLRQVCNLQLFVSGESIPGAHWGRIRPEMVPVVTDARYALCGHGTLAREIKNFLKSRGISDSSIATEVFFD